MLDTRTFRSIIEDLIPMNRFLGLKLENFDMDTGDVTTRLEMRPEYLGNAQPRHAPRRPHLLFD